jgi:hypothetical protein
MIEAIDRMVTEMKHRERTIQLHHLDASQASLSHNQFFYPQPKKMNALLQGQHKGSP